jgi:hypothetical protein
MEPARWRLPGGLLCVVRGECETSRRPPLTRLKAKSAPPLLRARHCYPGEQVGAQSRSRRWVRAISPRRMAIPGACVTGHAGSGASGDGCRICVRDGSPRGRDRQRLWFTTACRGRSRRHYPESRRPGWRPASRHRAKCRHMQRSKQGPMLWTDRGSCRGGFQTRRGAADAAHEAEHPHR